MEISIKIIGKYLNRIDPSDLYRIAEVRDFREKAISLRQKVSGGFYDNEDLKMFWYIVGSAGIVLRESNPMLAERAGLGSSFFSSAARDQRRPKLQNLLRALAAVIEVANERLHDAETGVGENENVINQKIYTQDEIKNLIILTASYEQIAKNEIERIDAEIPNDAILNDHYLEQRNILTILMNGFNEISDLLSELLKNPAESKIADQVTNAVKSVARQTEKWWIKNQAEAVDWMIRIPALGAGVATLSMCGANMTIGTSIMAVLVGGQKVVDGVKKLKK